MKHRLTVILVFVATAFLLSHMTRLALQPAARSLPEPRFVPAETIAVNPAPPKAAPLAGPARFVSASGPIMVSTPSHGRTSRTPSVDRTAGPETGPDLPPAVVLENMRLAFRQYTARYGGNPVGTNPEITRALNGGNPGQVVFVNPDDGLRINEQGELIDNWGTPFFFHQLSGTVMEIHSAGPDRTMWTDDDLVLR